MTGSADTAGTHAVGAIFGDTIQTNTVSTTFCNTVRANTICATFCNTIQTNAISATFCNTVRANAIRTIFGYAETLQSTLGTAFGYAVRADAICAIFSDYRGCRLLSVDLRQGESTGGQSGNNEAGEDLLFHVRSPEGGK